jgi:ribonuclease P protein component
MGLLRQKFTRQSRLLRPAEFGRVFQRPSRSGDNCFRILARPNGILSHRLGMAVAKKAIPKAVGRNRIKRLVRESFRMQMGGHTVEGALDIVVLPTAQAAEQSNKALFESLSAHWQKLNKKAASRFIDAGKLTKETR